MTEEEKLEISARLLCDFSRVPSTCEFYIRSNVGLTDPYYCSLEENISGRRISSWGRGNTPQKAVDEAVRKFMGHNA